MMLGSDLRGALAYAGYLAIIVREAASEDCWGHRVRPALLGALQRALIARPRGIAAGASAHSPRPSGSVHSVSAALPAHAAGLGSQAYAINVMRVDRTCSSGSNSDQCRRLNGPTQPAQVISTQPRVDLRVGFLYDRSCSAAGIKHKHLFPRAKLY